MVGVPRSSGCQLCRKRRVKCDEGKPACGNCLKYGVECPGYERAMKFVTGKHQIRSRASSGQQQQQRASPHGSQVSGSGTSPSTASTLSRSVSPLSDAVSLIDSPSPNRGQLVGALMELAQAGLTKTDVTAFLGFFTRIHPEDLGNLAVLDGAVCSLALHLLGKEMLDDNLVAQSRTVYGESLNALQATLRHPTKWKSSETLCSAVLLCFFELFAGTASPETWLQHARGIAALMEQRGPAAFAEGNDAAILLTFRGVLIMSSLFFPTGSVCFLARPEWQHVMSDSGRHLIHPPEVPAHVIHVIDGFFQCLVDLPQVMWWGYPIREALQSGLKVSPNKLKKVGELAGEKHKKFTDWYEEYREIGRLPVEVPSKDPNSPFTSVLDHGIPWVGSLLAGYWASMLILQELLMRCGSPVDYEATQKEFVHNILRSVETVGAGVLGPYRLGYSLRIAYEFASAEAQLWIRSMLDGFQKSYAATNKQTYPSPRGDDQGYS